MDFRLIGFLRSSFLAVTKAAVLPILPAVFFAALP
jgi:hypothetical protein